MAKWYGTIGYADESIQTSPGEWDDNIIERKYSGDILRSISRWSTSPESTNDDLNISNQISILADPFARDKFHSMKYIVVMGTKWKITSVEVLYPRLILTIGGVYNG